MTALHVVSKPLNKAQKNISRIVTYGIPIPDCTPIAFRNVFLCVDRGGSRAYTSWILCAKLFLIALFMRPTWDPPGADRTQVGPMWATWTLLSGLEVEAVAVILFDLYYPYWTSGAKISKVVGSDHNFTHVLQCFLWPWSDSYARPGVYEQTSYKTVGANATLMSNRCCFMVQTMHPHTGI